MTRRRRTKKTSLFLSAIGIIFASLSPLAASASTAAQGGGITIAPKGEPSTVIETKAAPGIGSPAALPGDWPVTNVALKGDRLVSARAAITPPEEIRPPLPSPRPSFVRFELQPLTLEEVIGPALEIMAAYEDETTVSPVSALLPSSATLLLPSPEEKAAEQFAMWTTTAIEAGGFPKASLRCLAEAIYFEARGESEAGQAAVAQVILNRVHSQYYPDSVCEVVYQNRTWKNRCQFSFACDGQPEVIENKTAWRTAERIAKETAEGRAWIVDVGFATHYHADYVKPRWIRDMVKTDTVGRHIFYRVRRWDTPVLPELPVMQASAEDDPGAVVPIATR